MSMSLVPYHSREGREIVLRHRNAIVVRDPLSHRLEIRGLTECPTCHQPLRAQSPERHYEPSAHHETYVDPNYFRMLRAGAHHSASAADRPPSSPIRRLVEPLPAATLGSDTTAASPPAEFVSSTPAIPEGSRIRREAFSPNYFNTFFIEEQELGRGGKGVVLLVRHQIDGCHLGHFACKRVPVGDDHAWLERVLTEVELLARLSHPNLVSYRHVWLEDVTLNRFGPSVACAFILQQYCNGGDLLRHVVGDQRPGESTKEELKARMRRRSKGQAERAAAASGSSTSGSGLPSPQRRLPFEEIYSLFKDITSGLVYLHDQNYIHRDLKPSNCLLHREGKTLLCLISDFGEVQAENVARKSTGSTGTVSYCAPEVLRRDASGRFGDFTTKSDIFSLGMILYFMCFGRLPYHSANAVQEELEDINQLRAEITDWKGFHDERRERPDLPSRLYQLLKRLLALDPLERPSAHEVLSAMKGEPALDTAFARRGRSASPPIGRRIQSLDSPVPSTPVPDPTKQARVTSLADEDLATVADEHTLQKRPTTPRLRAHAMTPSHSQDGYTRPRSFSPERESNAITATGRGLGTIPPLGNSSPSPSDRPPSPGTAGVHTPLLMPPPSTFFGDVRHRTALARHRAGGFARRNAEQLAFLAKLSVFLAKMATLTRACWPYSVDPGVGAALVALAALDLATTTRAAATDAALERTEDGDIHSDASVFGPDSHGDAGAAGTLLTTPHHSHPPEWGPSSLPQGDPRGQQRQRAWWWWYLWDWRVSCLLLALHLAALWVTSRYGALCAAARETWGDGDWV